MSIKKILGFVQEIATIMYVGGILSHIVIGILFSESNPETTYTVYQYKEQSAYLLILPGLALKIISDIILYFTYKAKPNWLKWKFLMMFILSINAFVFLVPMMPDLVKIAQESIPIGSLSQEFIDLEHTEQLVGQANIIPLLGEIFLGSFKPKLGKERKT